MAGTEVLLLEGERDGIQKEISRRISGVGLWVVNCIKGYHECRRVASVLRWVVNTIERVL